MPRLSTHVLDIARGAPAAGVRVDLHRCEAGARTHVRTAVTNPDGRVAGEAIDAGVYELTFYAGIYFRERGIPLLDPPFLDEIVIRFGVSESEANYHVPLLLAPHGYSTYRGS